MESGEVVGQESETLLSFEPRTEPTGIEIIDHIERRRCSLYTPTSVSPRPTSVDAFYFPVDRGVSLTTDRLTLPHTVGACLRNHAGFMVDELTQGESRTFPSDLYSIELSAPIKLYIVVEDAPSVSVTTEEVTISFERPIEVMIGARSHHKHPAATIQTTDDPRDMMEAISYLGSALKTTSVERSYPTLRGHPPTIELGNSTRIPGILRKPETGVTLELPADYDSIFVGSTLAYYLGADVIPGDDPRLVTDTGFVHELDDQARGFEGEVERVLKQVFFLDCLTRTEGFYPVNLHERNQIEGSVGLDFDYLYDQPIERQLEYYLNIPFSDLESLLPTWQLTAHVVPVPKHIEMLPFIINDLSIIKPANHQSIDSSSDRSTNMNDFKEEIFTRSSTKRNSKDSPPKPHIIDLKENDSLEQTWIGKGAPMGASKALLPAFKNRIQRTPSEGNIDIAVVCNDPQMEGERNVVDEVYGSRDKLPFNVSIKREVTVQELKNIFESSIDFIHYIGHIDPEGFECTNGYFNARSLDHSGVDAFFLNACTSYDQGEYLIKAGSICGIVTLSDVINSGAERIGKAIAGLLNAGFSMRASINIAKQRSIMGGQYVVLGDGSLDIVQAESGNPALCKIEDIDGGYEIGHFTFPTSGMGMGTIHYPYIDGNDEYYLVSGINDTFRISKDELIKFLSIENFPVKINGNFAWSSQINPEKDL